MRGAFSTGLEEMGTDLVIAKELSVRVWGGRYHLSFGLSVLL